ncbi:MAG: signal peptidase I [Ignavibacteria bacterium]|nr:signal peptidase I [Ignavibacteria bacterium]
MKSHKKKKPSTLEDKARSLGSLLVTLVVVLFIQSFFIQGYSTPTGSMLNTILIGDKMFFNQFLFGGSTPRFIPFTEIKLPYIQLPAIREPKRNDIVNFEFPGYREEVEPSQKVQYLKRIIGEPGDVIEIRDQVVYVNGEVFPLPEKGILGKPIQKNPNPLIFPKGKPWNEDNYGPLRVPKKGDVLELNSSNFAEWDTFIKREGHKIELKQDGRIFIDGVETNKYTVENNYYFMMGDNRNNSLDSRFWGFVKRELIVGKAWFTYFSWNSEIPFSQPLRLLASIRWERIGKPIR